MSWTYDLTGDVGKLRLRIQDTTETSAFFSDEELAYFIASEGSVELGAAAAFEALAARAAAENESERIGDYSFTKGSANRYLDQAKAIRTGATAQPAIVSAKPFRNKASNLFSDLSEPNLPNFPFGPYGNF